MSEHTEIDQILYAAANQLIALEGDEHPAIPMRVMMILDVDGGDEGDGYLMMKGTTGERSWDRMGFLSFALAQETAAAACPCTEGD